MLDEAGKFPSEIIDKSVAKLIIFMCICSCLKPSIHKKNVRLVRAISARRMFVAEVQKGQLLILV